MEGCTKLTNPYHILTFLLSLLLITPISASKVPKSYTYFIITSCNSTTYPTLCYKTLSPYASTIQTSPKKLINFALTITIQSAKNASKMVSKLAKQKGLKSSETAAVKDCIENIKDSIDELKQSLKAMGSLGSGANREFQMANAKTWMSAALTDDDTCRDAIGDRRISVGLKKKIRVSVLGVAMLTSNALSLVNHLT